jgi:hypothetical protein
VSAAGDTPPEVPEGVLVQSIAVDEHERAAGYRIYADGRYESLRRNGGWEAGERLGPERLAAVERAIESVPLDDLAGRYEDADDPRVTWMQVARGGRIRTVSVAGNRRVPELDRLSALLTDAFRAPPG